MSLQVLFLLDALWHFPVQRTDVLDEVSVRAARTFDYALVLLEHILLVLNCETFLRLPGVRIRHRVVLERPLAIQVRLRDGTLLDLDLW